jgi:predicted phage terminase large subunit-like protein
MPSITSNNQQDIRKELLRRNFHMFVSQTVDSFCDSPFYHELCSKLRQFAQDIVDKNSPRLVLSVPPRHLKSEICSVRFPLWLMLMWDMQVIVASYGQELTSVFSKHAKILLEHDYVRSLYGNPRENGTVKNWTTGNSSQYFATSAGGAATGIGSDCLITDDPFRDMDVAYSPTQRDKIYDWFQSVALTRLQPGGGALVIQTRWHDDDLAGRLETAGWPTINYPMLNEDGNLLVEGRYSLQQAHEIKASVGSKVWNALYMGRPQSSEDQVFKLSDLQRYAPSSVTFDRKICSWDFTFSKSDTSDYVVGSVWGQKGNEFYLVDVYRKKADFLQSIEMIKLASKEHPDCTCHLVEDKANGPAIISSLKEHTELCIVPISPTDSKITRSLTVQPHWEAKRVYAPHMAHWLPEWESEVARFPVGKHDDQVDSMTQALNYLRSSLRFGTVETLDFSIKQTWEYNDDDY